MHDPDTCLRGKYTDIERIQRTVEGSPYDAVIVVSPENVPYYSGFYNMDIRLIPERFHFVVWPSSGEPCFVVVEKRKQTLASGETFMTDVAGYEGEGLDAMRAIADVLADRGVTNGRVGIEGRNFPGGHLQDLQQRLPDVRFEDAYHLLESVRLIKQPAEIETITRVNQMTTAAIDTAFATAQPGMTERDVSALMQYELLKNGADQIAAPVFSAGDRSGYWHGTATDKVLEAGMIFKCDFGGWLDGYFSDIARTAVVGRASDRQRDIHAKLTDIKHHIVEYIRPGMPASEVARYGRRLYDERGLEYRWAILGHSIGLGIHESPQIYPWVDDVIEPNMTMMIEVGYTDYPNDSFHVEDLILVNEDGASYLTDAAAHEKLWEVGVD
jgi:Xaa-Pro aminopeptidase